VKFVIFVMDIDDEEDFEGRRNIIDLLDVRVTLAIEDGEKVAYVHCLVGEAEVSIVALPQIV
jgi:hypothetical protein